VERVINNIRKADFVKINNQDEQENIIMELSVKHVDVWAASIKDKPGRLARVLMGLKEAGADLDFIIARRAPEKPGEGVVFVTPLRGDREVAAAASLGFNVTRSLHSVRVMGDNRPGITADLTTKLAEGVKMYERLAEIVGEIAGRAEHIGKSGYSNVGMVVGGTSP